MSTEPRSPSRPDVTLALPNLLQALAQDPPAAPFLQEVGGRTVSYPEAYAAARTWAAAMRAEGVGPGDRVCSLLATGIDAVLAWMACTYCGALYVPLNTGYVGDMLRHALELTRPALILADARFAGALEQVSLSAPATLMTTGDLSPQTTTALGRAFRLAPMSRLDEGGEDDVALAGPARWTDTAALLFTSGTTGPSKAVVVRWLQLNRMAAQTCKTEHAPPDERIYIPWPLNHVSGAGAVYGAALCRGTAVLREKWSTSAFMTDIYDYRCTLTLLLLEMTRYVAGMDLPADRGPCPLQRVYAVPTRPDLGPLMDKLGARYCTSYNSTEQSAPIANEGMAPVPPGAAGRVRAGAEVRIVDGDGRDVAPGEVGELLTRTTDSAEMFAGYWEMPEATSEAMAGGWYHTSDAARMDAEGYVYFLERMKDRIRHRGENVSPFDVETTLHRHPGVAKCAVVGIPSVQYGEDEIVVFAVPAGDDVDSESVAAFAERELPKFMRPSRVVMVSELPETTTGKVQRAVLRARLLDEDGSDA